MNSLEKALSKAREQRKKVAMSKRVAPQQTSSNGSINVHAQVKFSQTRVQSVSPRVLKKNRVVAGLAKEPESDLYRILRTQVLQRLAAHNGRTLGICGANSEEGKTLTAINLAVSLALDVKHTVLLVDLDLRRSKMLEYFGLDANAGLVDYLSGTANFPECLINPGIDRLVLLPAGRATAHSSESLSKPAMIQLAQELKNRYPDRLILYDLPPLLSSDDSLAFLPHLDAVLMVVREGNTAAGEVQRAMHLLKDYDLIGTVLNGSAEENAYPYY